MKKDLKLAQFLVWALFAAPIMPGAAIAMEQPQTLSPRKQGLLRRLVADYKRTWDLRKKRRTRSASPAELQELDERMRRIRKQIIAAGLVAAFLAAIGVGGTLAYRKREAERAAREREAEAEGAEVAGLLAGARAERERLERERVVRAAEAEAYRRRQEIIKREGEIAAAEAVQRQTAQDRRLAEEEAAAAEREVKWRERRKERVEAEEAARSARKIERIRREREEWEIEKGREAKAREEEKGRLDTLRPQIQAAVNEAVRQLGPEVQRTLREIEARFHQGPFGPTGFMRKELKPGSLKQLDELAERIQDEISTIKAQIEGAALRYYATDLYKMLISLRKFEDDVFFKKLRVEVADELEDIPEAGVPGGIPEAGGGVPAARGDIRIESDEAREMLDVPDWEERTSYNWWEILGFRNAPSRDEARKAYKGLAKTIHPDVKPEGSEERAIADEAFKAISQAAGMIPK